MFMFIQFCGSFIEVDHDDGTKRETNRPGKRVLKTGKVLDWFLAAQRKRQVKC